LRRLTFGGYKISLLPDNWVEASSRRISTVIGSAGWLARKSHFAASTGAGPPHCFSALACLVLLVTERWYYWRSGPLDPAFNMAADEILLEDGGNDGSPVFRSYAWSLPAASFGYSQRLEEVETWTALRPLVRRCTGGGLVPHDADWTYAVVVPAGHAWWRLRASESYCRLHEWLRRAFGHLQVQTELAPVPDPTGPGRCFIGAEESDLLHGGRKIAGAAQRRNRNGLLIQGSVQPPPKGCDRDHWEKAMQQTASDRWDVAWHLWEPDHEWRMRAERLAAEKYRDPGYLHRR
jgi:hypothetical protein